MPSTPKLTSAKQPAGYVTKEDQPSPFTSRQEQRIEGSLSFTANPPSQSLKLLGQSNARESAKQERTKKVIYFSQFYCLEEISVCVRIPTLANSRFSYGLSELQISHLSARSSICSKCVGSPTLFVSKELHTAIISAVMRILIGDSDVTR